MMREATAAIEIQPLAAGGTARSRKVESAETWLTTGRFALLLGLLVVAAFPGVLLGGRSFVIRDFGLFSYPVASFHRECFWRGELPLWNPFNHCGVPFMAQWNTMVLYPASLIYLLLPLPWSLSFFCLVHLFWGGLGMFTLARRWTSHSWAAAIAGLVFTFNGLSLNFLMWPSHIATFSWLPWVVCLAQPGWLAGGKKLVWAILAASMQMLAGGPETIAFTWLILFLLAAGDWLKQKPFASCVPSASASSTGLTSGAGFGRPIPTRFLTLAGLVGLVCAAQLLPFFELLMHSQRDSSYSASTHDWSMPFWGWANFFLPLFRASPTAHGVFFQNGQYWTSSYYAGVTTVLLAVIALRRVRDRRVWLLAGLCFIGLVLAWGNTSVLYSFLGACFPPLGMVRYPVKFVILVLALAPLLAAFGFQSLANAFSGRRRFEWGCALTALLFIVGLVALDWNAFVTADVHRALWQNGLARAAFLLGFVLLAAWFLKSRGRQQGACGVLLLVCLWLDLATQAPWQNPTVPGEVYTSSRAGGEASSFPGLGQYRTMMGAGARQALSKNPLSDLAQNYVRNRLSARADSNLLDGVPVVDGFFSLVPREVSRVTALPYTEPASASPALLDLMGVSIITAPESLGGCSPRRGAMPLVTIGQEPIFADDLMAFGAFSKTNTDFRRAVFLPTEARSSITATRQAAASVAKGTVGRQKLSLETQADGASLVVIAQTWYPSWKGYIDGQPARIWRANYAFQALEVPGGNHHVELVYEDTPFRLGTVFSILGSALCLALLLKPTKSAFPVAALS